MKELSFYEQAGFVIPGSALLFGILYFLPDARTFFLKDGLTVGGLGLFLLIGYALGHLIAGMGNLMEAIVWLPSGMPSNWPANRKPGLLGHSLLTKLTAKLQARHGVVASLPGVSRRDWKGHWLLIYRDVNSTGADLRTDAFNGNYGLNRGLATTSALVAGLCAWQHKPGWILASIALGAAGLFYVLRMRRYGVYFAKEVFMRFLMLPDVRP